MNTTDMIHAEAIQAALLALDPSGLEGFEGFLGVILGEITGQSFRLAKSGTQRGRDGDSAFDGGATYFEGKRYKEGLSKTDIAAKIFDVAKDDAGLVDLWILGATCEVASQTVEDVRMASAKWGFGITVLDWSNNDLGSLLVAAVAAGTKSQEFIKQGLTGTPAVGLIQPALTALDYFENHGDFHSRLSTLRKALAEDVGLGCAKRLNESWLKRSFSNKARARAEFGQPLSPLDKSGPMVLDRPESMRLISAFSGAPECDIYAVVGEEGVGKSWLAVQGWNQSNPKSLLIMCPAEELVSNTDEDFDDFLIRKIIRQTNGANTQQTITRWKRRFRAWRANLPASSVRLTLIVDGLNQPLKLNWGRWLDRAAIGLKNLGGTLVLTTRTQHWAQLKYTLSCDVRTIKLTDWSIESVKQILRSRDINFSNTRIEVLESVRNPRLLGIAIELIEAKAIELLDELSVGRLLFEHMRSMQKCGAVQISALVFADLMKELAAKVLVRANMKYTDDIRLFDAIHESQLEAVASSQFFSSVKGSASKYQIKLDGLNLALALHLVDQLEMELRNNRDPREKLATMLEPISALDETAKVALLATQIACLDEETSPQICSALIENLVSLQNLPNSEVDAFAILAKSAPYAFLQAAEFVHLTQEHNDCNEWLLYALLNRRDEQVVWQQILESTKRWLAFYSLAPERRMHMMLSHNSSAQVDEERGKIKAEILERELALTEAERLFMTTKLVNAPQTKFDGLSRFAMFLLAGMPLEEVAPHLVRWRFAYSLNQSTSAPYSEFEQLLHYNRADWQETRLALLSELETLPEEPSSVVGKWTRVGILFGTGDVRDAKEGSRIFDELTRDRKHFESWSLKENYCDVDPCDPSTTKTEIVVKTAQKYRLIETERIAKGRGLSDQDHFFRDARVGVARFVPDDAIHILRALANEVLCRHGYERRQGVLELLRHSAALTKNLGLHFLSAGVINNVTFYPDRNDEQKNEFLTAQFSILIALPHLTADEQFDAMANMQGGPILLELLTCVRRASPEKVEQVLEIVLQKGDEHAQTAVLAAIHYSQSPLTPTAALIVKNFIQSPIKVLRFEALAVAASSGDTLLLQEVVDSGWRAKKPHSRDSNFEDWHGSTAILKALQLDLVAAESAFDRISLSHYGFAAEMLSACQVGEIAGRVEAALAKALSYEGEIELPDIESGIPNLFDSTPPLISLTERVSSDTDIVSKMNRLSETEEQFDERQRRISVLFDGFASELSNVEAELILCDLTFEGTKAIIRQDGDRAQRWLRMLSEASDCKLRHLHHIALQVAIMLTANGNLKAADLINRVLVLEPTISRVTGKAKISVQSMTLWSNSASAVIAKICKKQLQSSRTDSDIAREVIAAHLSGKVAVIQTYVEELLAKERPYETALALTVAGFCDESVHAEAVLSRFDGSRGFIGAAHAAARDSYARNIWAKTWYAKMLEAQRASEFWSASTLLMKIVDGRFDIWSVTSGNPSTIFTAFMPTIDRAIESKAAKIQKKREANLFGEKAPVLMMLSTK
tara:strand:- start:835280 stop:839881 length:4602 start_codon:yes stop_codon:yes gene_type:complete